MAAKHVAIGVVLASSLFAISSANADQRLTEELALSDGAPGIVTHESGPSFSGPMGRRAESTDSGSDSFLGRELALSDGGPQPLVGIDERQGPAGRPASERSDSYSRFLENERRHTDGARE